MISYQKRLQVHLLKQVGHVGSRGPPTGTSTELSTALGLELRSRQHMEELESLSRILLRDALPQIVPNQSSGFVFTNA